MVMEMVIEMVMTTDGRGVLRAYRFLCVVSFVRLKMARRSMDGRVIGHRISAAIGDQNGHVLAVVDLRPAHEGLFACGELCSKTEQEFIWSKTRKLQLVREA